jgi:hypothetical protein
VKAAHLSAVESVIAVHVGQEDSNQILATCLALAALIGRRTI